MMNENTLQSQELPGGFGGKAPRTTSIDLCKPGDLNLVYQSVLNGWDVPQHIRDQIGAQVLPAVNFYAEKKDARSLDRMVRVCNLALLMDVANDVDAGLRKSLHPFGRKRYPEKRKPRRSYNRDDAQAFEQMLAKLATTNPALADRLRAKISEAAKSDNT